MAEVKLIRGNGEYNLAKSWEVHPDAFAALTRMSEKFRGSYGAGVKKKLVSFGLWLLEKEIDRKGIKPGEDIETALGISADQAASYNKAKSKK
jgi:hypothetical protein